MPAGPSAPPWAREPSPRAFAADPPNPAPAAAGTAPRVSLRTGFTAARQHSRRASTWIWISALSSTASSHRSRSHSHQTAPLLRRLPSLRSSGAAATHQLNSCHSLDFGHLEFRKLRRLQEVALSHLNFSPLSSPISTSASLLTKTHLNSIHIFIFEVHYPRVQ